MSDLLKLADRIAAATGPSRELDLAIWQALRGPEWRWWSYPNTVGIDLRTIEALPNYTSSLDAITAAIRERFPIARMEMGEWSWDDGSTECAAWLRPPGPMADAYRRQDARLALALCEALIRAMAGEAANG